jgi:hypothetical protein
MQPDTTVQELDLVYVRRVNSKPWPRSIVISVICQLCSNLIVTFTTRCQYSIQYYLLYHTVVGVWLYGQRKIASPLSTHSTLATPNDGGWDLIGLCNVYSQ